MLLVALTSVSWHLAVGQCLVSPGFTGLHRCVLLSPHLTGSVRAGSRRYAGLLRCVRA